MTFSYDQAAAIYKADDLDALASDDRGFRYLLVKTLMRREYADELDRLTGQRISNQGVTAWPRLVFDSGATTASMEKAIERLYKSERSVRLAGQADLIAQLYKMRDFDWGGLHQNSLEKTIVDNYIKKISDFDVLNYEIENSLATSLRGYVQCSWYNHWTSIIIEDLFKDHAAVIPALGLIKKIDFFVNRVPFDLKVTYLPEGFVKQQRQTNGLRPELTLLKQLARSKSLPFDPSISDARLLEVLWQTCSDHPSADAKEAVANLEAFRAILIANAKSDPETLIRWLYENQGVRRFDASNRLFLILSKKSNFFESWKLKRAAASIQNHINDYLDSFSVATSVSTLNFNWEGDVYSATAGLIVVED